MFALILIDTESFAEGEPEPEQISQQENEGETVWFVS